MASIGRRRSSINLARPLLFIWIFLLVCSNECRMCNAVRRSSSSSEKVESQPQSSGSNPKESVPQTQSETISVEKEKDLVDKLEKKLEKKFDTKQIQIPEIKKSNREDGDDYIIGPHRNPDGQVQTQMRTHSGPIIIEEMDEIHLDPHDPHHHQLGHHLEHPRERQHHLHHPHHHHQHHHDFPPHPEPHLVEVEEHHHHLEHPEYHHPEYHHPHPIQFKPDDQIVIPLRPKYSQQTGQSGNSFAHLKIEQPNSGQIRLQLVPSEVRRQYQSTIPDLLAVLAPLAAIPLLGSLAVSSFTTMLTLTGLGRRRRRRRDLSLHSAVLSQLQQSAHNQNLSRPFDSFHLDPNQQPGSHHHHYRLPTSSATSQANLTSFGHRPHGTFAQDLPLFEQINPATQKNKTLSPISELFQLDVVQQYLRQSGRPDHNDQIIASYLACRGMFTASNHCLERLACHYADIDDGRLRPLERDVAALIIYSLLRNNHIDSSFKRRLQRAALFGYDHVSVEPQHQSTSSNTSKTTTTTSSTTPSSSSAEYEASFIPVCDRQFPCPKSEMP